MPRIVIADQGVTQAFEFIGKHAGAVQLYHLQGAIYLVQIIQTKPQLRFVLGIFYIALKRLTRIIHGLVDFGLDPA